MAHAVQCDRCKKFETFKYRHVTLPAGWMPVGFRDPANSDETTLLCLECARSFQDFMRGEDVFGITVPA